MPRLKITVRRAARALLIKVKKKKKKTIIIRSIDVARVRISCADSFFEYPPKFPRSSSVPERARRLTSRGHRERVCRARSRLFRTPNRVVDSPLKPLLLFGRSRQVHHCWQQLTFGGERHAVFLRWRRQRGRRSTRVFFCVSRKTKTFYRDEPVARCDVSKPRCRSIRVLF